MIKNECVGSDAGPGELPTDQPPPTSLNYLSHILLKMQQQQYFEAIAKSAFKLFIIKRRGRLSRVEMTELTSESGMFHLSSFAIFSRRRLQQKSFDLLILILVKIIIVDIIGDQHCEWNQTRMWWLSELSHLSSFVIIASKMISWYPFICITIAPADNSCW